jgi:hypothetical protein
MPRKLNVVEQRHIVEPEDYEGGQTDASTGVACVPRMQLREAIAAEN